MNTPNASEKTSFSPFFLGLMALYVTGLLVSNLIAGKVALIGGLVLPAAVILFPLTYVIGDVFTEVYGFAKMRRVIWTGFACNLFAVLVFLGAIALPHPDFWEGQDAFRIVLGTTPRILAASLAGYLFGEFSNATVLSKLKVKTLGKHLWFRTILSSVVGEALDTVIFISAAFWGTMPNAVLFQMMLFQYLWKLAYETILTPVTYAVVRWIKRREGIDVFDHGVKYSPF